MSHLVHRVILVVNAPLQETLFYETQGFTDQPY